VLYLSVCGLCVVNEGFTGQQGDRGNTGATGRQGATGSAGGRGDTGLPGNTGPAGNTGMTGPDGQSGATGNTGPRGLKGDVGPLGPVGRVGDTGNVAVLQLTAIHFCPITFCCLLLFEVLFFTLNYLKFLSSCLQSDTVILDTLIVFTYLRSRITLRLKHTMLFKTSVFICGTYYLCSYIKLNQ